jgi:hypothetical protein
MQFARSYIKYLYSMRRHPHDWANWHGEGNIGDAIQSLAMENLYREMGVAPESLLLIPRDAIDKYDGEPCLLPLQGWFGYFADIFPLPWSKGITPFFSGFHLTSTWGSRERFVAMGLPDRIRPFQPIGCRDRGTMRFLREQGLNTYLSGCLTLTFPARQTEPEDGKVFLVDVSDDVKQLIPPAVLQQTDQSITHYHYFSSYPVNEQAALEFENLARRILDRYRDEARLVITSRIHVALPCLAMGIPVVFLDDKGGDERFDALKGLTPLYTPSEMDMVNWNPPKPNLEPVKQMLKGTFFACFKSTLTKHGLPLPAGMPDSEDPELDMYMQGVDQLEKYELLTLHRQLLRSREAEKKLEADLVQKRKTMEELRETIRKTGAALDAPAPFKARLKAALKALLALFPAPVQAVIRAGYHCLRGR